MFILPGVLRTSYCTHRRSSLYTYMDYLVFVAIIKNINGFARDSSISLYFSPKQQSKAFDKSKKQAQIGLVFSCLYSSGQVLQASYRSLRSLNLSTNCTSGVQHQMFNDNLYKNQRYYYFMNPYEHNKLIKV